LTVRGLISIGTNSTRALVADLDAQPPATLLARSTGTRIGQGLKERGHLDDAAMQRTLDAIAEHVAAVREQTGDLRAIATSALRRADNAQAFADRVQALVGAPLRTISGDQEAACSFAGAVSGVEGSSGARFGVLDVGGGSSEYAVGEKADSPTVVSCEIGAVRLTEQLPELAGDRGVVGEAVVQRAARIAGEALAPAVAAAGAESLVLVGGSATTACWLERGNRGPFTYDRLSRRDVRKWIARLAETPLEQRKRLPGMNPQRADILLAGLLIVDAFLGAVACDGAVVSTNDVLLGYLLRHSD
jgi:exopolyphosphatase/guanosine-5'-triphosphate,3'-diphosphate pyrophosphatase